MNNVDVSKYKRIVQYFWDPEPKNDDEPGSSIWCLGKEYRPSARPITEKQNDGSRPNTVESQFSLRSRSPALRRGAGHQPDESETEASAGKVHAGGREWPTAFLDDF